MIACSIHFVFRFSPPFRIKQCEEDFFILVKPDDVLQGVQEYLAQWQLSLNDFHASLIYNYWKLKRKVRRKQDIVTLTVSNVLDSVIDITVFIFWHSDQFSSTPFPLFSPHPCYRTHPSPYHLLFPNELSTKQSNGNKPLITPKLDEADALAKQQEDTLVARYECCCKRDFAPSLLRIGLSMYLKNYL